MRNEEINCTFKLKQKIKNLIDNNASERDIQEFLKQRQNMYILAEVYANPKEEYIIFSEFPIGENKTDFVIFASRSKMNIIIIEIKGADFYLMNCDSSISHHINSAIQQIVNHFGYIKANYEYFRRFVHTVRESVEKGIARYNALIGPRGFLYCDSCKDILYRSIVIGGRTRDDKIESELKWKMEELYNYRIQLESWDSWFRKVI